MERQRRLQRADDPGTAGVADEPVDIRHCELHACENLNHGGVEIFGDEIRDRTLEHDAESFRVDIPTHDAERIGPKVFAGAFDLRRAAITGAQNDRRGAVAEQADGNDVGLGELVEAKRQRAQLDRHQQHVGARSRLCKARRNRQARNSPGTAEAKYRHARDVGSECHTAGDTGFETRRRDAGGADGHHRVDIAAGQMRARQCLLGGIDKQRFGAFEKSRGALRPAARFKIPLERLHAVTFDDAGIGKNA